MAQWIYHPEDETFYCPSLKLSVSYALVRTHRNYREGMAVCDLIIGILPKYEPKQLPLPVHPLPPQLKTSGNTGKLILNLVNICS